MLMTPALMDSDPTVNMKMSVNCMVLARVVKGEINPFVSFVLQVSSRTTRLSVTSLQMV